MEIDIEILKKQNSLLIENDKIYVKPISEFNYITFPIEDLSNALILTVEEYLGLRAGYYKIKSDLSGIEIKL